MIRSDYKVYKHTSPQGKVYIGITCKSVADRWGGGTGYKSNKHFFSAIQKYGWDNFKHEVLFENLTKKEACEKEIALIAEYDSTNPDRGYNQSSGGQSGAAGVKKSEETKQKTHDTKLAKKANGGKSYSLVEILKNLDKIEEWARAGASEANIAARFGITRQTFWKYKNENGDIFNAIKKGRTNLVEELKGTLAKKAKGFHYTETKKIIRKIGDKKFTTIEEYERYSPPDTGAIHLLLKNLDETWTNDDKPTMELKKQKIELDKQKAESENW